MAQSSSGPGLFEILLLGVGAYLVYNYWVNSQATAAAATTPATPVTPPAGSTPAPSTTVSAADVSLAGPVTANVNNSLTANVSINGTITNVSIIQATGHAYNTAGVDVTSSLAAMGVNLPALLTMMQTSYAQSQASGVSGYFSPWGGRGIGQWVPARRPVPMGYVRSGAYMRRIS